jgi:hypothetical protein
LGHVLFRERVKVDPKKVDPKKVESINEWWSPMSAKVVKSFLGLANFYNEFIKDFSTLAKLLTNLLKKEGSF